MLWYVLSIPTYSCWCCCMSCSSWCSWCMSACSRPCGRGMRTRPCAGGRPSPAGTRAWASRAFAPLRCALGALLAPSSGAHPISYPVLTLGDISSAVIYTTRARVGRRQRPSCCALPRIPGVLRPRVGWPAQPGWVISWEVLYILRARA